MLSVAILRGLLGFTQHDLARVLRCSQPLVALVEKGERNFSPARRRALEQLLSPAADGPAVSGLE
ncbi:MAG TPA: hypothetical protein VER78_07960 [Thermoanaerobaculia bacterium]|nr:hypothetical protein [Thermoanaerobaculia bacterium]